MNNTNDPSVAIAQTSSGTAVLVSSERLGLLRELERPASAAELARRLGEPRQRINYHLRELETAGLVRLVEERRRGNCTERIVQAVAKSYVVSPEVLAAIGADPERVADRTGSAFLVAIAGEAIREVAELRERSEHSGKRPPTLSMRNIVRFDSPEAMSGFAEELTEAVGRLVAKYHRDVRSAPIGREFKVNVTGYPVGTRPKSTTT